MAVSEIVYQERPPEVVTKEWTKETDAAEIAAWCGGTYDPVTKTMRVPDVIEGDGGTVVTMPAMVFRVDHRYSALPLAEFLIRYTKKVI